VRNPELFLSSLLLSSAHSHARILRTSAVDHTILFLRNPDLHHGLLGLRVRQVDLRTNLIRLDVGTTKNGEGREVTMTRTIGELVREAVAGKKTEDY
jgi:hypothetical protein